MFENDPLERLQGKKKHVLNADKTCIYTDGILSGSEHGVYSKLQHAQGEEKVAVAHAWKRRKRMEPPGICVCKRKREESKMRCAMMQAMLSEEAKSCLLVLTGLLPDHDALVTTGRRIRLIIRRTCFSSSSSGGGGLLLCQSSLLLGGVDCQQRVVLGLWRTVRATHSVTDGKVLSVVAGEEKVVQSVVRGAIDHLLEWRVADHVRVVDQDAPQVDKHEEADGHDTVKREDEGEDVVRQRLEVAIKRVESVTCVRRGDEPLVVRLVDVLVDSGVMLNPVDPVDEEVGEDKEEGHRESRVAPAVVGNVVVELTMTTHLQNKPWDGEEVKREERTH